MHKADFNEIGKEQIIEIAREKKEKGCSLTVIVGYTDKEGEPVIAYSYDDNGSIQTYKCTNEKSVESITPVYETAAEWFEEEISELMGIEFAGLEKKDRLFLPEEFDGSGHIIVSSLSELRKK